MLLLHGELDLATSDPTKWMLHIEPVSSCCPLLMGGTKATCLGQGCKEPGKMIFQISVLGRWGPWWRGWITQRLRGDQKGYRTARKRDKCPNIYYRAEMPSLFSLAAKA